MCLLLMCLAVIHCFDDVAVPGELHKQMMQQFPSAKDAGIKNGGDFPYLSRAAEVNLHLTVHLRNCHRQ